MSADVTVITVLVLLLTFAMVALGSQTLRRQRRIRLALRRINAYRAMPNGVAESVESERPMHVSFGGSGLGAETTISAIATAEVLYHLSEQAAVASQPPIVSLSDPTTLGLAQGALRRAYEARDNMESYRSSAARWYPQGPRSLAFAAGVAAALAQEDSNMSVLTGRFGPEIVYIGEAANRYNQLLFAQSDQLDGQAVAWVMSDTTLIGEELYVGGAYLAKQPSALHTSQIIAMDGLRVIAILGILLAAVLALGGQFFRFISDNPLFILIPLLAGVLVVVIGLAAYFIRQRRKK